MKGTLFKYKINTETTFKRKNFRTLDLRKKSMKR